MSGATDRPSIPGERTDYGWLYDYDSFSGFLADADAPFGDYRGERSSQEIEGKRGGWSGTRTFKEAVDLAWGGWGEGGDAIRRLQEALQKRLIAAIPALKVVNDVVGGAYDMEALVRGEAEPAFRLQQQQVQRRAVDVSVNLSASAAVRPETLVARGGLMAGLVFAFDRLNIPSRVTALHACRGRGGLRRVTRILIKGEGEPLDSGKVAYALGHPSMLRRLIFCHYENAEDDSRRASGVGYGYGTPTDTPAMFRGEVHLDKAGSWDAQWANPVAAMNWIMSRLAELGLLMEHDRQ